MSKCALCGTSAPEGGKFCSECGAPLAEQPPARRQARKVVTVLFSDVTGFTTITERLDPEALRTVMERYFSATREVIERHGGRVEKFIGDAVMAVFGLPVLREDDALRAMRAAVEIREAVTAVSALIPEALEVDLTVSTGVNTGEVFASEQAFGAQLGEVIGDAVNVAARLESAASPGEILLGEITYQLTRASLEAQRLELSLKGKTDKVAAYRLIRLASASEHPHRRLSARTVGREAQAKVLSEAFEDASARRTCVLVTVLGLAGKGKSRLVRDALRSFEGRARILTGRCLPYGEATIFWPLAEIACEAAGIRQDAGREAAIAAIAELLSPAPTEGELATAARLAGAFGLAPLAGAAEEISADAVKLVRALATSGPLVAVIEDLHWASAGLLATLEHLAARLDDVPLLLICTARPELLEARPDWPGGAPRAQTVTLGPLADTDCAALIDELLEGSKAAWKLTAPILAIAGGNPLVVEEILAMLIDDGVLSRETEHWQLQRALPEIRIPPTIEAILGARLDRLSDGEREVIEGAAIVGKEFDLAELQALADLERPTLTEQIGALLEKQLIEPAVGTLSEYRFHHILVRDAAYAATPKRRRAQLHERCADFIDRSPGGRNGGPYGEIAGEHLERACVLLRELGEGDNGVGGLAHRAGKLLAQAGRRAHGLSDLPATHRLYARGEAVVGRDDRLRPELLTGLAEALFDVGDPGEAQHVARAADRLAVRLSVNRVRPRAGLIRARADVWCGELSLDDALVEVREIVAELEQSGDDRSIVWGWMTLSGLCTLGARFGEASGAGARAVARVRRSTPADLPYFLAGMCVALARSPVQVREASERCEQALGLVQPDTLHAAIIEQQLAVLEGMAGSSESARKRFTGVAETCTRYGSSLWEHLCCQDWGVCELMTGHFEASELRLSRSRDVGRSLHEMFNAASAALHAQALARLGRFCEALEESLAASSHISSNDLEGQVWWRIAAALAFTGLGELDQAETRANEAVAIASPTEAPLLRGDTLACLGEVLLASGRPGEGQALLGEAIAAYEAKGIAPAASAARELRGQSEEPILR